MSHTEGNIAGAPPKTTARQRQAKRLTLPPTLAPILVADMTPPLKRKRLTFDACLTALRGLQCVDRPDDDVRNARGGATGFARRSPDGEELRATDLRDADTAHSTDNDDDEDRNPGPSGTTGVGMRSCYLRSRMRSQERAGDWHAAAGPCPAGSAPGPTGGALRRGRGEEARTCVLDVPINERVRTHRRRKFCRRVA